MITVEYYPLLPSKMCLHKENQKYVNFYISPYINVHMISNTNYGHQGIKD